MHIFVEIDAGMYMSWLELSAVLCYLSLGRNVTEIN